MVGDFRNFSDCLFGVCDNLETELDGVDIRVLARDFGEIPEFRGITDGCKEDDVFACCELLDEREADTAIGPCDKPILSHY
jgi:hypothetical protein